MKIFIGIISVCLLIVFIWLLKELLKGYIQYQKEQKEYREKKTELLRWGGRCSDEKGDSIETDTPNEKVPDSKKQS